MNRIERISAQSRQHAGWCIVSLSVAVAGCVWAMNVAPSSAPGGCLLVAATLIALSSALYQAREAMRLRRIVKTERYWDNAYSTRRI